MLRIVPAICIGFLVLGGCMSTGTNYNASKVSQIQKGVTTEAQLIEMFGKPNQRSTDSSGATSLQWTYMESVVKAQSFIPYAGAFLGGTDNGQKFLLVNLDSAGKVVSFHSTVGELDTRHHTLSENP